VQRYEYRELVTDMQGWTRVRYVDGTNSPIGRRGHEWSITSTTGGRGWDLVSVCAHGGRGTLACTRSDGLSPSAMQRH